MLMHVALWAASGLGSSREKSFNTEGIKQFHTKLKQGNTEGHGGLLYEMFRGGRGTGGIVTDGMGA